MDLSTELFICFIVVVLFLSLREILKHKATIKTKEIQATSKNQKTLDIDAAISGAIAAIPEIEKTLDEQKAAFAKMIPVPAADEQKKILKPIEDRLNLAKMARDNEWIVRILAPYADTFLKGFARMFK